MKFILISRHTDGREVPEHEREQNMKDMGEWIALLHAEIAMPPGAEKVLPRRRSETMKGMLGE